MCCNFVRQRTAKRRPAIPLPVALGDQGIWKLIARSPMRGLGRVELLPLANRSDRYGNRPPVKLVSGPLLAEIHADTRVCFSPQRGGEELAKLCGRKEFGQSDVVDFNMRL